MRSANNETDAQGRARYKDNGARKAAILLSVLDRKTAQALLNLFEPEVAAEIASEAKRVKPEKLSTNEIELIVREFVDSFFNNDRQLADALLGEAKQTLARRDDNEKHEENIGAVVNALAQERPTISAAILSTFSKELREKALAAMPKALATVMKALIAELDSTKDPHSKELSTKLANAFWERADLL